MKLRQTIAALTIVLISATLACAQEAPPISAAQIQKLLKSVDTIGAKQTFPAPTAQSLGLTPDPLLALPVVMIVTDDHSVYLARSEINRSDYIIWVRTPDNTASYMFATHPDFEPTHGLYLRANDFPMSIDLNATQVQAVYRAALTALGKDADKSRAR